MNILLVEDDQSSRIRLGKFLREIGHHVIESDNSYDALEQLKFMKFQLVLSDIKMPKITGIELLRMIKSLPAGQDVDVVLFTGYSDMETAIEALRAGAYDYLIKPINIEELVAMTERAAEHQFLRREHRILTNKFENEVEAATQETRRELFQLKKDFARLVGIGEICIFSDTMRDIFNQAYKFHTDRSIPVLIQGETGTGKEIVARYIHFGNSDVTTPFVDINCAALTPGIFESELFGYEAGAFTGGLPKGQRGKLDIAKGGTIFLDEITELSIELQAKLLRAIQEKEFYRVGGLKKIKTDVRIICATNIDIEKKIEKGAFRQDLFYRLNVGRLFMPPLRERTEDIIPLASMFLNNFAKKRKKRFSKISDSAANILLSYQWPGNVRELKNVMELITLVHDDVELKPSHLGILSQIKTKKSSPESVFPAIDPENFSLPAGGLNIESYFNEIIRRAYKMHNGNKTETARYLGISRSSLYCHLKRLKTKSTDVYIRA